MPFKKAHSLRYHEKLIVCYGSMAFIRTHVLLALIMSKSNKSGNSTKNILGYKAYQTEVINVKIKIKT